MTATDVETSVTVDAGGGAPARELEATAARIAFDRTAETLAVEELVTEIAGIRAAWQLSGTSLVANPTVGGSVTVDPAAISIVFEQLQISPPTAIEPSELGTFTLAAQFSLQTEPQVVQLTGVNAELLGMRVTGEGSLTGANELAGRVVDRRVHAERRRSKRCCAAQYRRRSTSQRSGPWRSTRASTRVSTPAERRCATSSCARSAQPSAARSRPCPASAATSSAARSQRRGSLLTRSRRRSRPCCRRTSQRASSA